MLVFAAIAWNGFMEIARQPVVLLLTTTASFLCIFLASIPYFGLGDDAKLVKDSVLAVMFLAGLFGAVLSASNTLAREIRTGTALTVLSKPVSRTMFLLGRYAGLLGILTVTVFVNMLACLLASRLAYDAYGEADLLAFGIYALCMVLAYLGAAFSNYFLRRPFVSDALGAVVIMSIVAFIIINCINREGQWQHFGEGIDWRMAQAGLLILFAVWMLAALALACSTRLEMVATLAVCTIFFLAGLVSDYFFGTRAQDGNWWATAAYYALPNWQQFWVADALADDKHIPWSYLGTCLAYAATYSGAALALGLALFQDRELN